MLELDDTPVLEAAAAPELTRGGNRLRAALVAFDLVAVVLGWVLAMAVPALLGGSSDGLGELGLIVVVGVAVTMLAIVTQGLYRARVCAVRAVETARLGRAAAASGDRGPPPRIDPRPPVHGWAGPRGRRHDLVPAHRSPRRLRRLAASRPRRRAGSAGPSWSSAPATRATSSSGSSTCTPSSGCGSPGFVGPRQGLAHWDGEVEWLGEIDDGERRGPADAGANGVIVAVSDVGADELNRLTRELLAAGIHVQLSSGLRGIDQRRLRSLPLAHEPLFYLEPASLSRWQLLTKRVVDLILAGFVLVLATPVLARGGRRHQARRRRLGAVPPDPGGPGRHARSSC